MAAVGLGFDCGRVAAKGMTLLIILRDLLLRGCSHRRITRPYRDEAGAYTRCLECGSRIAAPLWDMER